MKYTTPVRHTLRFRRWSRKAYAAFVSIGRCVSIGCLRKSVADSSLSKQKAAGAAGHSSCSEDHAWKDDTKEREKETEPEPLLQMLLGTQVVRPSVHTGEEEEYILKLRKNTSTDYRELSDPFITLLPLDNPCFFFMDEKRTIRIHTEKIERYDCK